jgi:RHS repeat-associated protein
VLGYIYGPNGMPVEQINNTTEKVTYLHHDQQGSTRLLTGSTGTVTGAYTYSPYGATEGHTGMATTPLGYDGQYTSSDTGLIYLRARSYDPSTAQFMTVDPLVWHTRAPYTYAGDNPLNQSDPTGLLTVGICVGGEIALGVRVGIGVCGQVSSSGEIGASGTITGGVASGAGVSGGSVSRVPTRNILKNLVARLRILVGRFMLAAGYRQTRSMAGPTRAVTRSLEAKYQ